MVDTMRLITLLAIALCALFALSTSASAQFRCGPRAIIVKQLEDKFHETSGGMGLSKGVLFEIWSAPSGTFTILTTTPQNISCIMAAGKDWTFAQPKKLFW